MMVTPPAMVVVVTPPMVAMVIHRLSADSARQHGNRQGGGDNTGHLTPPF
jgi:hypothetical protein